MDLIGKIIGHYKIIKQSGSEEMADLYEGVESRRGYPVLIKALPFLLGDDPALLRRFQQVAQRLAALKNPHILSWHDIGQEGGALYIITRMVQASPLIKQLRDPLRLETALRLIYQMGEALQYAHQQDLVHGDLNPQKVLLTEDAQVLITDLGLSSLLKIAPTSAKPRASAYAAPEVRAGLSPDRRSDVYSLGAILYALLTGRAPAMTTPAPPSRFNAAIPPAVEKVILKSLSSSLVDRYQSVADMITELSLASLDLTPAEERLSEQRVEEAEVRQEKGPEKVEEVERREGREEGVPFPEIPPMLSLDMEAVWGSLSEQIDIQQADITWEAPAISIVEPPPMPSLDIEAVWQSLSAQASLPSIEEVLSFSLPAPPPMPDIGWETTAAEIVAAPSPPPERKAPPPPSAPPSPPRPRRAKPVRKAVKREERREEKGRPKTPVSAPPRRRKAIPEAKARARPRSIWRTVTIVFFALIGITILAFCGCCGLFSFLGEQATPSRPTITRPAVSIMTPQPTEALIEVAVPTFTPAPAAPQASPAPTEAPTFADDFDQPDSGWAQEIGDDYEMGYFEGQYRILVKKKNTVAWSTLGQSFTDFITVVEARQAGGPNNNGYGLIYRYQDKDNFYYFRISGNGFYSAAKMVDGKWKKLVGWTKSPHINKGQGTNHLKLICRGRYMSFYVNGKHLFEWWDSTFAQGDIGLAAGTYDEAGVMIYFDNLEVYAPQ